MTIGSGIAIAAVWIVAAFVIKDNTVSGLGMVFTLAAAVAATGYIAGVRP